MEKWIMKIATFIIILIALITYISKIFTIDDVAVYDYGVEKDKTYVVNLETRLYDSLDFVYNNEKYDEVDKNTQLVILNPGTEVLVIEREKNYAKVEVKIEENVHKGYVNAWFISNESSQINEVSPYLGLVNDATAYKVAKEVELEKYDKLISGVAKVVAKCNGFVFIKTVDFETQIDEYVWVKEEELESYNSLKIDIGYISTSAKIYKEAYEDEFLKETVTKEIKEVLSNNLVKISDIEENDKYFKIEDKNGNTGIILKTAFLPISSTTEIN